MVDRISECQQNEILEAFQLVDIDGDGVIGIRDMQRALKRFGESFTEEEIEEFIRDLYVDVEADGTIDAVEFALLLAALAQRMMLDHLEAMEKVEALEKTILKRKQDELALSMKQNPGSQRLLDATAQAQKLREKMRKRLFKIRSQEVKETYKEFDAADKGFISFEDVFRCGTRAGEEWGFEELNEMMDFAVGRGLQRRIDDELFEAIIRKVPMEWSTDKPLITEDLSVGRTYADTLKSRFSKIKQSRCSIM